MVSSSGVASTASVSGGQWAKAFDNIRENGGPIPDDLKEQIDEKFELNFLYKGRTLTGTPLFAAIEYCADEQSAASKRLKDGDTKAIVKAVLEARADPEAWASHKAGTLQPIHYASGLGSIEALEALRDSYSVGSDRLKEWKEAVKRNTKTEKEQEHYSPLHDAVWFGREDVVHWLLDHGAGPQAENRNGETPLILVAKRGLYNLVLPLVQKNASLQKAGNGSTPLSVAVDSTQFPVEKFHLLAKSCHDKNPSLVDYLADVYEIAVENEQGANIFVDILLGDNDNERPANDEKDEHSVFFNGATKFMRCHWSGDDAGDQNATCNADNSEPLVNIASSPIPSLVPTISDPGPPNKRTIMRTRSTSSLDADSVDQSVDRRNKFVRKRASTANSLARFSLSGMSATANLASKFSNKLIHKYAARKDQEKMDQRALEQMADILKFAPKAAGNILEMLLDEPHTENPQHNPLPLRANLGRKSGEPQMNCKYVSDLADDERLGPSWKFDTSRKIYKDKDIAPEWQLEFAPMLKNRNDDLEVEIKVCRIPRVLDVRMFRSMALTDHLDLFGLKTVQAMIHCQWNEVVKFNVYMHMFVFEVSVLLALIMPYAVSWWATGGFWADSSRRICFQRLCWAVLTGTALRELWMWCYTLKRRYKLIGMAFTLYDIFYVLAEAFLTALLLALVLNILWETGSRCDFPKVGTWLRGFLAVNFFLRWVKIMYTLRSNPYIGPKIVSIVKSFLPMTEMIIVTSVLFFGFGFSAILMGNFEMDLEICAVTTEDKESCGQKIKTPLHLILHLFKALLLGDGEAFDNLRDLQGADQDQKFSTMLVVTASTSFTICVLNLFMAVYSNEYDQKNEQSSKLFYQERAIISFECMLQPLWGTTWERRWQSVCTACDRAWRYVFASSRSKKHTITIKVVVSLAVFFLALFALVASIFITGPISLMLATAAVALMQLLLGTFSLRNDWVRADRSQRFFLWICSPKEELEEEGEKEDMKALRDELKELKQLVLARLDSP